MPKLPGRESSFRTYLPGELLVGYFMGPVTGRFRCVCCGELFDGYDPPYGGRATLDQTIEVTVGEVCGVCIERILKAHPDPNDPQPPF